MPRDNISSEIKNFFARLQGQDRVRKQGGELTILQAPESPKEKDTKRRILYLQQHVRNKNYNRRHVEFFDEYRRMVATFPIIKAGVDIYGEEICLSGDTLIPLLNGENKTIQDLFDSNSQNFWIYSYDYKNKKVIPVKCEKVVSKGLKKVYEVLLDDGTKLKATEDHLWLLYDGSWVKTIDLKEKDSLRSFYTRKDYAGYLEISAGELAKTSKRLKWEKVHSIVGNVILKEEKKLLKDVFLKNGKYLDDVPVIHHKTFNKLNNDPSQLEWMSWKTHREFHISLNKERWNNEEFASRMKAKFSKHAKELWNNLEWRQWKIQHQSKKIKENISLLTSEQKKIIYGHPGQENGMYGSCRREEKNPNYNENYNHIEEIDYNEFKDMVKRGYTRREILIQLNTSTNILDRLTNQLKQEEGLKQVDDYFYFNLLNNYKSQLILNPNLTIRSFIKNNQSKYKRIFGHASLNNYVKKLGYKGLREYKQLLNHKVVSVKEVGEEKVFDLFNCGEYENFAIKAKEGMVIVHNCAKDSTGNILKIKTNNHKVKKLLEECFFKNLKLNSRGYLISREVVKFGNVFAYLITRPRVGVTDMVFLPPETVIREQMINLENLDEYRFAWYGGGTSYFEPWEIVHWRNIEDIEQEPYGTSVLRCIVDTWRRIVLMREALVIYRVTRAPAKLLWKIGTDGMSGDEAFRFAQDMKKEVKKKPLVNPETGEIDFKYSPLPLSGETPIPLLDGRTILLKDLAKEYEEGKENYVYSIQDKTNKIVPGKIQWCGKNYTADKLIRVWLDNNSYVDSAPEHPFILKNGETRRADELKENDSLMPFYKDEEVLYNSSKYIRVYNPETGLFEFTHRLIAEELEKNNKYETTVHHKDFNRYNNPNNLLWINFKHHKKMHGDLVKALWRTEEYRTAVTTKSSATLKRKYESGELDYVKKSISISSKKKWEDKDFREMKSLQSKQQLVDVYNSDKGEERKRNIGIAASEYNKNIKWGIDNRDNQLIVMSKYLNDSTWNKIVNYTIQNNPELLELTDYINNNLIEELNDSSVRKFDSITWQWVRRKLREKGFESYTVFKASVLKNHKVSKIEILENQNQDVYCMTVVGLKGENDRHNFAYCGKTIDGGVVESGSFVKNSIEEDIWMPTYEGSPADVTVLEGAGNLDAVEDYGVIKDDLFAGLKIPKSWLTFEEDLCFVPETQVVMLDGEKYSIEELAKKFNNNESLWVYSTDEKGNIVPGEVEWVGMTKKTKELYEVELDNGQKEKCTANHPWRLRDGSYKRADELKEGDSLMPLYTKLSEKKYPKDTYFGYEEVWHNGKQKWEKTHQIVGKNKYSNLYEENTRIVLHHDDFNKSNNHPANVIKMTKEEHFKLHAELANNFTNPENRAKLKLIQQTPEFKEKCSISRKLGYILNPWRRQSVSDANRNYNKAGLMQESYLNKLATGEISQSGENNGNYKERISKQHLHDILRENVFYNVYEINSFIKINYPEYKWNYTKEEIAEILGITVSRLELMILCDKKGKNIKFLDFEKLEEYALESESKNDFYKKVGKSQTGIWNYFERNGLMFNEWWGNIKEMASHNHCVVSVKQIILEEEVEVYDLKIKDHHNFALASGVFVHNSNKAALSEEDVRFAKTTQRMQGDFLEGCVHIGLVHLFMNGCSEEEMQSFTLEMNNPSTGSEKRKQEILGMKLDNAVKMWDSGKAGLNFMSYIDVLKTVFKCTDEEIKRIIKSQFAEKKLNWRLKQIDEAGYYDEPDLDKLLNQTKSMTGGQDPTEIDVFKKLGFEGTTFTEVIKSKIDLELKEMFGEPPIGTPSLKTIKLIESSIKRNLEQVEKDLKN